MEDILIPLGICCVMPVAIVAIISWAVTNANNQRSKVLIEAIKSNASIDANKLAEALAKSRRTPKEILNCRLLTGCVLTFVGIAAAIIAIITVAEGQDFDSYELYVIVSALSIAIGLAYLIVYFVTRKDIDSEYARSGSDEKSEE